MKGVSRNQDEVDGSNVKEETLVLKQLSPSIHKFYHELIYSGLSTE